MSRSPLADICRMTLLLYAIAFSACSNQVAPQESTPPTTTTHQVPASVDPTGTQDVSVPLQAWLDSLPDSSKVIGPAGARYRVEFGITAENRYGLRFDAADPANPPMLFQTVLEPYGAGNPKNRTRKVLLFRLGSGHAIRHWKLKGAQPNSGVNGVYRAELEPNTESRSKG